MGRAELYPMAGRFEAGAVLAVRVAGTDARWGLTELAAVLAGCLCRGSKRRSVTPLRVRIRARDVILALAPPDRDQRPERICRGWSKRWFRSKQAALEVQLRVGGERLLARVTRRSGESARARTRPAGLRADQDRGDRPPQPRPAGRKRRRGRC